MPDLRKLTAVLAAAAGREKTDTDDQQQGKPLGTAVLFALQFKNIYGGTVPPAEVERRRRHNRHARRARRGNTAAIAHEARSNRARNSYRRFARGQAPDPLGLHTETDA